MLKTQETVTNPHTKAVHMLFYKALGLLTPSGVHYQMCCLQSDTIKPSIILRVLLLPSGATLVFNYLFRQPIINLYVDVLQLCMKSGLTLDLAYDSY